MPRSSRVTPGTACPAHRAGAERTGARESDRRQRQRDERDDGVSLLRRASRPTAVEALWCGELLSATPAVGLHCDPATAVRPTSRRDTTFREQVADELHRRHVDSRVGRAAAYQAAQRGATSTFFYVRRFDSTAAGPTNTSPSRADSPAAARESPFSLTDVHLEFDGDDGCRSSSPVSCHRRFRRVSPTTAPDALSVDGRSFCPEKTRRRFRPAHRSIASPGRTWIATAIHAARAIQHFSAARRTRHASRADLHRLPTSVEGTYRVLLRIEATDDREGDSNLDDAGAGTRNRAQRRGGWISPSGASLRRRRRGRAHPDRRTSAPFASVAARRRQRERGAAARGVDGRARDVRSFLPCRIRDTRRSAAVRRLLPRSARRYEAPWWIVERSAATGIRWRVTGLTRTARTSVRPPGARCESSVRRRRRPE